MYVKLELDPRTPARVMDESGADQFPGRRYVWVELAVFGGGSLTVGMSHGLSTDEEIVEAAEYVIDAFATLRDAARARLEEPAEAVA